ncbi:MAG: C4-dicarboxylate ABC transporter [Hoeflea sp.]|uniref:TRAP transporter large permease n=1 Tax=Hoeflea sp. TaxID=1940281 RepID=UPI000C0DE6CD|nr:TRAP transporter large permease [Hoeflea sp.]PHR20676.1 MAG: C4-dicarboxylate ABC transporter [Hoeflea sp.]
MSDLQFSMTLIGLLVVLILIRVPIGVALIGVSFVGIGEALNWRVAWGTLGIIPYQFSASWVLSSVPTFLFMGFICYHTRLTQGLFNAARVWLSALPGGMAVASVFGCAGFAAVTGSSVACSAAMGRVAVPEMVRHNYSPLLATGTVAAAGTIGALIPPSILMIMYGIIAQVPISKLFLGGISIGILTMASYVILIIVRVKLNPELAPKSHNPIQKGERLAALAETWPVLLIVLGVFGGLFSGVFTPTEAGAVGASLSCLVSLIKRTLNWHAIRQSLIETLTTTSALLVIAVGASMLTRFLALSGVGDAINDVVLGIGLSPTMIIFAIIVIYLLLGMMLEPIGAMLLTLPIVLPIVDEAGFSLLWFGVLVTKVLEVGMITPPVGMNVYVIKSVVGDLTTTTRIFQGVAPFVLADLVVLAVMVAAPALVLYLPTMIG